MDDHHLTAAPANCPTIRVVVDFDLDGMSETAP
jgi:hypothetical protein